MDGSAEMARMTPKRSRSASGPKSNSIPAFACWSARSTPSATAASTAAPAALFSTSSAKAT